MPGVPADPTAVSDIETELTGLGVDASLHGPLLLAVDKAGFGVEPSGGGSFLAVAESLDTAYLPVAGVPGLAVLEVTMPDASIVRRIVTAEEIAVRVPAAGIPPTTTDAGATAAIRYAIAGAMAALRLPLPLLTTLAAAIDAAGYVFSPKAGAGAAAGTALAADLYDLVGFPGMLVASVTMPDASVVTRVIADRELAGTVTLAGNAQ